MNALARIETRWFVAYTAPRAEQEAKRGIEEIGHEVFLPVEKLRQKVESRRLWKVVERPLFSRYIFVNTKGMDWGRIANVDGINDVLRNNDIPSTVPGSWVDALRKAESYGVFDRTQATQPFGIGERVRVSDGPFAGRNATICAFIAKFKSATAKKRAKVLLDFFGQKTSMDIDICGLEKL